MKASEPASELSTPELLALIRTAFPPLPQDKNLTILIDLPPEKQWDHPAWQERRAIASAWLTKLIKNKDELGLETVSCFCYKACGRNNADLPDLGVLLQSPTADWTAALAKTQPIDLKGFLASQHIILAPTEYSATAPLKFLAQAYGFRAATMGGFSASMLPALRLDWSEVATRVDRIKRHLDIAVGADILFETKQLGPFALHLDLRFRPAFGSPGVFPTPGSAGNLPSGESYIVPYEGEGVAASLSHGVLPVQFDQEIVLFQIQENRACAVLTEGTQSDHQARRLSQEPALGNIAELGIGVLRDLGIKPIGELLLDEKLGLHIAFGRSDHFGGAVGPKDFNDPGRVEHLDHIYIPETQDLIRIKSLVLIDDTGQETVLFEHNRLVAI